MATLRHKCLLKEHYEKIVLSFPLSLTYTLAWENGVYSDGSLLIIIICVSRKVSSCLKKVSTFAVKDRMGPMLM